MVVPVISDLPPAPTRSDGAADFTPKADVMIGALQPLVVQVNIGIQWMNGTLNATQAARDAAAESAGNAADSANAAANSATAATDNGAAQVELAEAQVVLAAEQVGLAATQANNAAASATGAQASAAAAGAAAGLPSLVGNAGKSLMVNPAGNAVLWDFASRLTRITRTSNTQLAVADKGSLIDITSGTFEQTFAAAATLANGWFCYLRNSGTGDITLNPNNAEVIDGLSSYIMYPGEARLIQCDGVGFTSIVINTFVKTFTASGNFIKPPGYSAFAGLLWAGGGASVNYGVSQGGGGGGAACAPFTLSPAALGASTACVIGSGGLPDYVTPTNSGSAGSTSAFAGVSAYGGASGQFDSANIGRGGGGGGVLSAGVLNGGGNPTGGIPQGGSTDSSFGGGVGGYYNGTNLYQAGNSVYGGGGGLRSAPGVNTGCSVYGGGGGYACYTASDYGPHTDGNTFFNAVLDKGLSTVGGRGARAGSLLCGNRGAAGSTSITISFNLAGKMAGDVLVAVLASNNAADSAPTAPGGWTQVTTASGGAGSGQANNDGPRRVTVFTKISDGTEASVTFSLASGTDLIGQGYVFRKNAGAASVDIAAATGIDNTIGAAFSVTTGALDVQAGDILVAFAAVNTATPSFSNLSISGPVTSTFCRLGEQKNANTQYTAATALASGASSGGVTFSATASAATLNGVTGAAVVVRVRGADELPKSLMAQAPGGGGCGQFPGARGEMRIWGVI